MEPENVVGVLKNPPDMINDWLLPLMVRLLIKNDPAESKKYCPPELRITLSPDDPNVPVEPTSRPPFIVNVIDEVAVLKLPGVVFRVPLRVVQLLSVKVVPAFILTFIGEPNVCELPQVSVVATVFVNVVVAEEV